MSYLCVGYRILNNNQYHISYYFEFSTLISDKAMRCIKKSAFVIQLTHYLIIMYDIYDNLVCKSFSIENTYRLKLTLKLYI